MESPRFADLRLPRPDLERASRAVDEAAAALRSAVDESGVLAAVDRFERVRRDLDTWSGLAQIRFRQDTRRPEYAVERGAADEAAPRIEELRRRFTDAALEHRDRELLTRALGAQALALWQREREAFEPRVGAAVVRERELQAEYTALIGSARIAYRGTEYTLAGLTARIADPDPGTRGAADAARWAWFADHGATLDRIFDDLVRLRTSLARDLGHADFRGVGYARMRRVDLSEADVAAFRGSVREHVVPLAVRLAEEQRQTLGLDRLRYCDERVPAPEGEARPRGDGAWLADRATGMFDSLQARHGGELGDLYRTMRAGGLLDLDAREGKGPGGFCSFLRARGVPFVFASFSGTADDTRVFTHEMGHAYQGHLSRTQRLTDYGRCTSECAEIHSMSLEFLCWPELARFFAEDAHRFRRQHLIDSLRFLPFGCAIDHFQHELYAHPELTPAERHATWRRLERQYLPWRDYAGAPHPTQGGFWHRQLHLYQYPFYYIDYVLAGTVALQFWELASRDPDEAWRRYHVLCPLGGSLPFRALIAKAGFADPFEPETLASVVETASRWLAG